jgi:anti-anti-sigma factor
MRGIAPHSPEASPSASGDLPITTFRSDRRSASVSVRGDLDVAVAAQLWSVLLQHLTAGRRYLRLDLSGVTFFDSSAVTAIVEVHHEALYRRGTLVLVGVTPLVAKVLSLTGADENLLVAGPRSDNDRPRSLRSMPIARDLLGSRAWPSPRR